MAFLAKMMRALLVFQILHLTLASANHRPRKAAEPMSYAEPPDYSQLLNRRGGVFSKTSAWPRKNLALDSTSCSSHAGYLAELVDNINDMIGSAINALGIIRDTLGVKRSEQSADERAKMDFFMAMYGLFDPTSTADITRARARLTDAESFAQQLADGLSLDTFKTTIFCNDDHLVATAVDKDGEGTDYVSTKVPIMKMIDDMPGKCATNNDVLAFMVETRDNSQDVMTICPISWSRWKGQYISQYAAQSLADVLGKSLDEIGDATPEVTLLHELTHASSFFGDQLLEDQIVDGVTAYRYDECYNLGQLQQEETQVSSVLALQNADTFSYFCAAMYLEMCNWRDGICKDPSSM